MAKDAVKSETGERRVALGERRRVAEMSPEEMRRALQGDDNKPRAAAVVQAIHGLGGVGKTQLAKEASTAPARAGSAV